MSIISDTFSSLKHRNFRIYFVGLFSSFTGYWMQSTVVGWLAYRLTDSAVLLGLTGLAMQLPLLIFGLFAGVLADRIDKRKGLIIAQSITVFQALLLGILTVTGFIEIWHILFLSLIWGILTAFTLPLRHAFTFDLVGKKDIANALALNSMLFNVSRIIGPAAAGFLVAYTGEGPCFFINAVLVMILVGSFIIIKPEFSGKKTKDGQTIMQSLKSGLHYAWKNSFIKHPLMLLFLVSFIVMPVTVLMPIAVKKILSGDAKVLGLLMSGFGVGAFLGSLSMAAGKQKKGLGLTIGIGSLFYGLSIALFSLSQNIYLSCIALGLAGVGISRQVIGVNTLIQSFVSQNMRGRVMSLYMITFVGFAPFGSVILGKISDILGISATLLICGVSVILSATWFLTKVPLIRISAYRLLVKEKKLKGCQGIEFIV